MKYQIEELSLDEKLKLLTGKDFWRTENANGKIPSVFMSDGPSGLRKCDDDGKEIEGMAMPCIVALANTWSEDATYLNASLIADECVEKDVDVLLAPGVNIKRTPLCGRNFEYFSEDPYLSGVLAKSYIRGLQDNGVGACIKHFCCNNSEEDREFRSSEVDERTLREIYARPFEIALKEKPWMVMCSYNPVNGIYASENKKILKELLRERLGFDGVIVSDWGAVHNSFKAVKATLDLRMAYYHTAYNELKTAYDKGLLKDEEIDFCVKNLLGLVEKKENATRKVKYTKEQRTEKIREIAEESIVLLKNEANILPLNQAKGKKVYVVGEFAENPPYGGGGSSNVKTSFKTQNLADILKNEINAEVKFRYVFWQDRIWAKKVMVESAYNADYVVLCVGEDSTTNREGADRRRIRLPLVHEEMIESVSKVNENVIVVVHGGSAIDMSPWIDKVKAVLFVAYAGEQVNYAISNIVSGKVCPSGKLSETFPMSIDDIYKANIPNDPFYERYTDGVFVGYRYYEKMEKETLFPFGYGLSYAKFIYSNLKVNKIEETVYDVEFDITNNSNVDAKEIAQIYVKDVFSTVSRPNKELKAFKKVEIKAGETKKVEIRLDKNAFAYYSTMREEWFVENGYYEIMVGASSKDIKLVTKIKIECDEDFQQSVTEIDFC